ncbi:hypothetical protein QQE94_08515 [Fervidobacterium pennivorans subsp. shakshaketiis]|jgi:hypothetical protein|uniref:Uncharacterized protein n=1 Tax=Fervidobacterium pennivorans (strain DSM 9078 / Ven5) TaxID=771875 RepID=H9UEE2_FERPD|nr:hypothetical protein [Fervidobacterium pennivorans]AFG35885.1 hypothetical protein Ferpe_1834 [Fervidobacterium pennivorans DSM 9078]QIV78956.1 hypothetical protein HER11_08520 [Fervidobacterium pennivorans subsp. keratinolyticus]
MREKTDRDFFRKFPLLYVLVFSIGVILLFFDFSFLSFLQNYMTIVEFAKIGVSIILIASSIFEIIFYLFSFIPLSKYDRNFEELKTLVVSQIREKGHKILGEFLSFRPWMTDEYFVKSNHGVPKYFYPVYYVVISVANNMLYINEVRFDILHKSYHIVGYSIIPLKTILSAGLVQDKILFSTASGEDSSTAYFLEIRSLGGTVKVPVFEEEITSRFGDIKNIRDETIIKLTIIIQTLTQQKVI